MAKKKSPEKEKQEKLQKSYDNINKKQFSLKKAKVETILGVLRVHPRGFGFVVPHSAAQSPQDIFIPKFMMDSAVDGDTVEVEINPQSNWEKGPDGKILAVLKRGRTHLAGTILQIDPNGKMYAHIPILGADRGIPIQSDNGKKQHVGDRVILKVVEWGDQEHDTVCQISHTIGHISDPSCDIRAAIEEYDLKNLFSQAAIEEAEEYGDKVQKKDQKGREDFTKLEIFTIDPETAKDFDDALSLSKDRKGIYHLGVHIADVAHYVTADSSLDKEAQLRCNSTYLPGTCIPMLPEELSNQLCSLRPKVIRLTVSVLMDFDPDGTLINHTIIRSFIKSAKRFTYEEAKEVIDKKKKSPFSKSLDLMVELCLLLKKKRYQRGSIDFSLPDMVIQLDEKGAPTGVKMVEYDISHQLVEEFMLKANEIVAKSLSDRGKVVPYRIHEQPSDENIQDFFQLVRSLGFSLPQEPRHFDIQKLFEEAKKTPFAQQLSVAFIRSMKLACYSAENVGHYGLALEYYTHFTSPIRRYTDLIVQRLLFGEEDEVDVEKVSLKCSEQERVSFRAENSVKILKKLRLLQQLCNQDPDKEYNVFVTKIKPFGLFFELPELMLEGFLHISELENDYFVFDGKRNVLWGRHTGKTHKVGESLRVLVTHIDLILLESKWMLVGSRLNVAPQKKSRKRR